MTRPAGRLLLAVSLLLAAAACRQSAAVPRAAREPRDIILVTIDTLRADAVGFDGNTGGTTPHLDAVAAAGRVYTFAHAHNPLTLPSHTNILTGLYPFQHGVRDNAGFRLDPAFPTAATLLKGKGYATGAFIAAFPLDSRYGLARGFDRYEELYRHVEEPQDFQIQQSPAADVVAAALDWYTQQAGRRRFLWIHLYDPHAPYDPPAPFKERFADPYLGEVAYADSALAPLLLAVTSGTPAPLLIVTADHGEARGDHGELTHGLFAYESTLHVPLFLWCPPLVAAGRESASVRHVDLLPTILDVAEVPAPANLPGLSLLDKTATASRSSYFESLSASYNRGWAPLKGLIEDGHKYVDLPVPELYDLARDPAELANIVGEKTDVLRRLRADFARWPEGPAARGAVSGEEAAKLRSLGYLSGPGEGATTYGPADDPKNRIAVDRQLHDVVDLFQRGELRPALALARQVVLENPRMKMGYQQLAFLLQESGDLEGAIRLLERGAKSGAGGENMDRRRALLLAEAGRPLEGVQLLEPFRRTESLETLNAFGICLSDAGRVGKGLAAFRRVLDLDAGNAQAFQNAGIALLKLDRIDEARKSLEKALAINARNPRAWNALGVAWMRQGVADKALDAWSRCVLLNPKQWDALYNIALVAARSGDRARAREALERFIAGAPRSRYAGDLEEARAALKAMR